MTPSTDSGSSSSSARPVRGRLWSLVLAAVVSAAAAAGAAALLLSVQEHKAEGKNPFFRVVDLDDETTDPALWGKNFPLHYDDYKRTVDQVRTRYGGSEAVPHTPSAADPRSVVAQQRLEEDPRLKAMWSGYAFSRDFREDRGHAFMLIDQQYTERQQAVKQPGTCLHCHASVYVPYKKAGGGDVVAGFEKLNQLPYSEAVKHVKHPIACIDCHDPDTMALRITRPAFREGIAAFKAAQGISGYDVDRDATRQEMRSYVCGQCHVEYYFKGPEKRLTYPWSKGLKVEDIYAVYEEAGFKDWSHKDTGAQALKVQHPEFELWSQGTHARAGVACADCHMPYKRVGAQKISDHHVRSPLLNVAAACQTCHRVEEAELKARAEANQDGFMSLRDRAMDALMALITELKAARDSGRPDAELAEARGLQRKAQFWLDFVEAENSVGFHAPQEALRILGESIDASRSGQLALRGGPAPAPIPPSTFPGPSPGTAR